MDHSLQFAVAQNQITEDKEGLKWKPAFTYRQHKRYLLINVIKGIKKKKRIYGGLSLWDVSLVVFYFNSSL